MNIAFFGEWSSLDYYQIGGTESYARRLAEAFIKAGDNVAYIMFGSPAEEVKSALEGKLKLYYFRDYSAAENFLKESDCSEVLTTYIPMKLRIKYMKLRLKLRKKNFYLIVFNSAINPVKKLLSFADYKLYYKHVFSVSPALLKYARKLHIPSTLILPPVSSKYYMDLSEKTLPEKPIVIYMGRLDKGKGAELVFKLFSELKEKYGIDTRIYSYIWEHDKESSELYDSLKDKSILNFTVPKGRGFDDDVEESLVELLKMASVVVLPYNTISTTVNVPLSLLEAMAAKCAVITTRVGDMEEVYGKSDYIFNIDEITTDKVIKLLSRESIDKERQRVQKRTEELRFDAESTAEAIKEVMRKYKR